MKKQLSIVILIFTAVMVYGQEPMFNMGDKVFNATIGLGSALYTGTYYSQGLPPIAVSIEKAQQEDFIIDKLTLGLGGYAGFTTYKWDYGLYDWGYKYTHIIIGARGVVHYPLVDKMDIYTGIMLGVNIISANEYGNNISGSNYTQSRSGLATDWFAGARYYFSDNMAVLAEVGYGIAYLNVGIAMKLNGK